MKNKQLYWPDLIFPPINLWSYPVLSFTYDRAYKRWRDMYCADEIEAYFKVKNLETQRAWEKAGKEFDAIYARCGMNWSHV